MIVDTREVSSKIVNFVMRFFSMVFFPSIALLVLDIELINIDKDIKYILSYLVSAPIIFILSIVLSVINGGLWRGIFRHIFKQESNIIFDSLIFSIVFFVIAPTIWASDNHISIYLIILSYTIPSYIIIFLMIHSDFGDYKAKYVRK